MPTDQYDPVRTEDPYRALFAVLDRELDVQMSLHPQPPAMLYKARAEAARLCAAITGALVGSKAPDSLPGVAAVAAHDLVLALQAIKRTR